MIFIQDIYIYIFKVNKRTNMARTLYCVYVAIMIITITTLAHLSSTRYHLD